MEYAAVLAGDEFDLDDWRGALQKPFDPWIEPQVAHGRPVLLLRSARLSSASNLEDACEIAKLLITYLNGIFRIDPNARTVTFAGIAEIGGGSGVVQVISASVAVSVGRVRVVATAATGNPQTPTASKAQRWSALAATDQIVADMLLHNSRGSNWYDLFKTFEGVRALCGSGVPLQKRYWAPSSSELSRFTQTANRYRHASTHSSAGGSLVAMPLDEASKLVGRMVDGVLSDLSP